MKQLIIFYIFVASIFCLDPQKCDFLTGIECSAEITLTMQKLKENKDPVQFLNEFKEKKKCLDVILN